MKEPLVSIVVITYNSSKYVLETLESAKEQTYQNVELIISDDGSTDDTVAVCRNWLAENEKRFVRTEFITINQNKGIPANCNRGLNNSKGTWVKLIAGDDMLMENCIEANITFITSNPEAKIIQSECLNYNETFDKMNFIGITKNAQKIFFEFGKTPIQQYEMLLDNNELYAPSIFYNRKIFQLVDGYDEEFKIIEDYPFWLKASRKGFKFFSFNKPTVCYRIHYESIQKQSKPYLSKNYLLDRLRVMNKYHKNEKLTNKRIRGQIRFRSLLILDTLGFNNNSKFSKIIYLIVNII
jgi:alpha-1,3-rhamnosyltransferase